MKKCNECGRVLVEQKGMEKAGAGNWDGITMRCEFCKSSDYASRCHYALSMSGGERRAQKRAAGG